MFDKSEKDSASKTPDDHEVAGEYVSPDDHLGSLSERQRDEILKQYDLPKVKVNLFTLLGYGTPLEFALQIVGSVMSAGAGAALPFMTILFGSLTNLFGGVSSPGAVGITSDSVDEFNSEVSRSTLIIVYIGISVFVASYIGTVCWIIAGERISRRIRT
jgi:ATP-binding cassette subfamily B (MDR/TAP) protein 1